MNDADIRGKVLRWFYDHRDNAYSVLTTVVFKDAFSRTTLERIARQLNDKRLIESWRPDKSGTSNTIGIGRISAEGTDVIEETRQPPIAINLQGGTVISVHGSQNVQIGDNNVQTITQHLQGLVNVIDSSTSTTVEKQEAKSLLKKFLEHPVVATVLGTGISHAIGL